LLKQFERWGITAQVQDKLMQAQPGIPVGALLAQGRVALGFQQLSEMMGVQGITVLGPLPDAVQVTTTFSGAVSATCDQAQAVQALLHFWASASTDQAKVNHGMQVPVHGSTKA
jgi:molybdate transport system substrate-binding protein